MKAAGLIFDNSPSYLDHLAPLCGLLGWPLILCEPDLREKAASYYPDLTFLDAEIFGLGRWINERFSHLVSCSPRSLLKAALGDVSFRTFWLPHGHSDKGQIVPFLNLLREEECSLLYGQKMVDQLISFAIPNCIRIGNFRWLYYQKHRTFYDALSLGFSFPRKQKTVLYAPTWEDAEHNCSLWDSLPSLARTLPSSLNLLVKPHPNTILRHAPRLERLMGTTERENLQFLLENSPIFPLLERCDVYLGDRSSIGYDCLFFDKPLYFLDPHDRPEGRELLVCGERVSATDAFSHILNEVPDLLSMKRKAMLHYAFDEFSDETAFNHRVMSQMSSTTFHEGEE